MKLLVAENDIKEVTELRGYNLFAHQRRKKAIIALISKASPVGSTFLDIGCGSGDISVELSLLGYKVHGIDFEPLRINQAKYLAKKYYQRILFENISFEELDAGDGYDGVLLGEVLEHFVNPVSVLRNIKRLLKPGAKVFITTPNMPSLRNRLKFGLLGIFPDNNPEHKYYFDYGRLSKVVAEAGYKLVSFKACFTNLTFKSKVSGVIENAVLFWFSYLFNKSGDTIFAIISPRPETLSEQ